MDLKVCIWFILILAIGQAHCYIKCKEMKQDTDKFQGRECHLNEINENYFLRNEFYDKTSGDKVQILRIRTRISDIPEGIGRHFSNLTSLDLSSSGLKNLQKKSLDRVPATVQELIMTHSHFTTLSKDMFTNASQLRLLDLASTTVDRIHDKAFTKLTELRDLRLNNNRIKTIAKEMFDELPNLVSLDLSGNLLSGSLEPGILGGCPNLEKLKLEYNHLTAIKDGFVSAERLQHLTLSWNSLTYFDTKSLIVEELIVDNNRLTELYIPESTVTLNAENNKINRLTCATKLSIKQLKLAQNSISSMDCIGNALTLENLSMGSNNIGKLNHNTFAQLSKLRDLQIGNTNLSNFVPGVLDQQIHLVLLNVSYNHLGNFPIQILRNSKNLRELYIEGNNMTKIPIDEIMASFKSLQLLGIGENNLICDDLEDMIDTAAESLPDLSLLATSVNDISMHTQDISGIGCEESYNSTDSNPIEDQITDILKELETLKSKMKVLASDRSSDAVKMIIVTVVTTVILIAALAFIGYQLYEKYGSRNNQERSQPLGIEMRTRGSTSQTAALIASTASTSAL